MKIVTEEDVLVPLQKKAIPRPSLSLLAAPASDQEYVHFENSLDVPFDTSSLGFSRVNAWWLADASLLAYWGATEAEERFRDGGRLRSRFIANRGTQCYVAWNDAFVVVAFRGTQSDSILDVVTDLRVELIAWDVAGERVHSGFRSALNDVWDELFDLLKELGSRPVWMTGHSLGAALATLAGYRYILQRDKEPLGELRGIYTFGCPLVGDRQFVDGFNAQCGERSFRFVNDRDSVTRVPPPLLGYHHVNTEHVVGFDDPDISLTEPLIDHTPRRYAVLVWNALVDAASRASPGSR